MINKRLIALILMTILVITAGCTKNVKANKSSSTSVNEKTDNSETEGEETEQTTTEEVTTEEVVENRDYSTYSNEKYSWWFKRNENHERPTAQDNIDLSKYDAFYLAPNADEKVVYLTFDCGYENGFTNQILDILKEHNAKACFFVTQTFVRDNPDISKRMKDEGHIVGDHTVTHPSLPSLSDDEVKSEIKDCANYFKETTGYDIDKFVRPPMGEYSERTLQITDDLGYKTIFWSMAYLDYDINNQPGRDYVVDHFNKYCHNGAIPLIHNVSESNANALDEVLTNLENDGYRFGTVDELSY